MSPPDAPAVGGRLDRAGVRDYERRRYRSWDQRLVHRREARAVGALLERACGPRDAVLDMPCGYGRLAGLLARRAGSVVAADASPAMARRALELAATGMPACAADVRRLPFADGSFDGAVVLRLLQHLTTPEARAAALAEVRRVVGRWAVVSAYTGAPLHRLVRRLQGRPRKILSRARFEAELRRAGLRPAARRRPLPLLHAQTLYLVEPGPPPERPRGPDPAPAG